MFIQHRRIFHQLGKVKDGSTSLIACKQPEAAPVNCFKGTPKAWLLELMLLGLQVESPAQKGE